MAVLCAYQVSFSDHTLFPANKRATAIGICQFFARGLTTITPEIAELPKPLPMLILCTIAIIAIITTSTLNSSEEKDQPEKSKQK